MTQIRPRETVVLATDFAALLSWYQETLGFALVKHFEEYSYANLETPTGIKIGIADAAKMGIQPVDRSLNTVILQFEVDDLKAFFEHVEQGGGSITFGPSFNKNGGYWFGGLSDPEGNPIWVVDKNCP